MLGDQRGKIAMTPTRSRAKLQELVQKNLAAPAVI
jgi:hypothetical protein